MKQKTSWDWAAKLRSAKLYTKVLISEVVLVK